MPHLLVAVGRTRGSVCGSTLGRRLLNVELLVAVVLLYSSGHDFHVIIAIW
jgi:hypothetical protein